MELQPVLRPRVATLAAKDLWEEEQGVIPPERRADIEVYSWGHHTRIEHVRSPVGLSQGTRRAQAGFISREWCVDLALVLAVVGVLVFPW